MSQLALPSASILYTAASLPPTATHHVTLSNYSRNTVSEVSSTQRYGTWQYRLTVQIKKTLFMDFSALLETTITFRKP